MTVEHDFRTLNYLGCKLRILDFIERNIKKVTPSNAGVCDLFAGSGCVSYRLAHSFPLIACDIQGYSSVVCNALLQKFSVEDKELEVFFKAIESRNSLLLKESFSQLIVAEETAINEKDTERLSAILEHGSVQVFELENCCTQISLRQKKVSDALRKNGLYNEKSLISRYYGGVYFSYRQAVEMDILLESSDEAETMLICTNK